MKTYRTCASGQFLDHELVTKLIVCLWVWIPLASHAETYTAKIRDMPDFCQSDTRYGKLPKSGTAHCGPVAVSNALVWLSKNGFPALLRNDSAAAGSQFQLISELSSPRYMKTHAERGTKPKNVVAGLKKFVSSRGYDVQIQTMGWRSKANRVGRVPDIKWIMDSVKGTSNLILNIGWYVFDASKKVYQRTNGHYLTLVGFELENHSPVMYVHDPAERDGLSKKTTRCVVHRLQPGAELRLQSGKTISADGFYELDGVEIKEDDDLAIIDGAISFRVF